MPKTFFEDGDIINKIPGTRVFAAWLNKVFSHRHDGRDQDGSAPLNYAADTGAVNALETALTPSLDAPIVGMPIQVKVGHTNTDVVTLNVDGLGAEPLRKLGDVELAGGDLRAGQIIQVAWDGAAWQLLSYNSPPVTDANTLQGQGAAMLAPPGAKGEFFMPTVPAGWLPCDGRAVLRAQYPALFAAIGTTWGAGDNVSTFNLPEVRGEFFRAWDNGRGIDIDRVFGSWQGDTNKSHHHQSPTTASGGVLWEVGQGPAGLYDYGAQSAPTSDTGDLEARPRNIATLVCIKY